MMKRLSIIVIAVFTNLFVVHANNFFSFGVSYSLPVLTSVYGLDDYPDELDMNSVGAYLSLSDDKIELSAGIYYEFFTNNNIETRCFGFPLSIYHIISIFKTNNYQINLKPSLIAEYGSLRILTLSAESFQIGFGIDFDMDYLLNNKKIGFSIGLGFPILGFTEYRTKAGAATLRTNQATTLADIINLTLSISAKISFKL